MFPKMSSIKMDLLKTMAAKVKNIEKNTSP